MTYKLVNLTGNDVKLWGDNGRGAELPAHGRVKAKAFSRLETAFTLVLGGCEIDVMDCEGQDLIDLPGRGDDLLYVVSGLVAAVASSQGRDDCISPGRFIRHLGEGGEIGSARTFIRYPIE